MKYRVQLNCPGVSWSEWRDIAPIPEKLVLSIQFDKLVSWEVSNATMKILTGAIDDNQARTRNET